MQYKKITNAVESGTRSEGDYYGGCTTYAYKRIEFKELSVVLFELGLLFIEGEPL